MKKLTILALSLAFAGTAFAQKDFSLSKYPKLTGAVEEGVQGFTDGLHGGLNSLEWTDGSGPTLFRIGLQIHVGAGMVPAAPEVGLKDAFPMPSLGAQLNLGTMGAEGYFRIFPEIDMNGAKYGMIGFGLKYDITDFIPVTGFPSTSAYISYSSLSFSAESEQDINGTEPVTYQNQTYDAQYSTKVTGKAEISASSFNVGAITSYDLVVLRVFGRVALEMGSSEISWNGAEPDKNQVSGNPVTGFTIGTKPFKGGNDFGNSSLRIGAGLSLIGIKAEVGYRSGLYAGVGYGFTF